MRSTTGPTRVRAGRVVLTLAAAVTGISPFLADWNRTHIYNEKWPPHAKFHNAQTLSMGALLSAASLFFTWRRKGGVRANLLPAVGFGSAYWVSQSTAFAFPGVAWTDPHLLKPGQRLDQFPQQVPLEIAMYGITGLGAWLMASGSRHERRSRPRAWRSRGPWRPHRSTRARRLPAALSTRSTGGCWGSPPPASSWWS